MRVVNIIKRLYCFATRPQEQDQGQDGLCVTGTSASVNEHDMVRVTRRERRSYNNTWNTIGRLQRENREMDLLQKLYPTFKEEADAIKYEYATYVMDLKEVEDQFRCLDPEYYDYHFSRFMLGTCRGIAEQCQELHMARAIEFSHLEHFVHTTKVLKASLIDRKKYLSQEISKKERDLAMLNASTKTLHAKVKVNSISRSENEHKLVMPTSIPAVNNANVVPKESSDVGYANFEQMKREGFTMLKAEQERNRNLCEGNWKDKIEKMKNYIALTETHIDETLAFQDALQKVKEHVFSVGNLRKALPEAIELLDQTGERAIRLAAAEVETIQAMKARHVAQFHVLLSEWELLGESTRRLEGLETTIAAIKVGMINLGIDS